MDGDLCARIESGRLVTKQIVTVQAKDNKGQNCFNSMGNSELILER